MLELAPGLLMEFNEFFCKVGGCSLHNEIELFLLKLHVFQEGVDGIVLVSGEVPLASTESSALVVC